MTNKEIATAFRELGQLMELHQDNPFKIRSYQNAYMKLRKLEEPLAEMDKAAIGSLSGIGPAITGKIQELTTNGRMETLEKWRAKTPAGVIEMLGIGGFGPKKIRAIWKGLGVENIGELLYAVNENRLVELKGFGAKTQQDLKQKLEFFQRNSGRFHYRSLEAPALELLQVLGNELPEDQHELTGNLRRLAITLERIEILSTAEPTRIQAILDEGAKVSETFAEGHFDGYPVTVYHGDASAWGNTQFKLTAHADFLSAWEEYYPEWEAKTAATETDIFTARELPLIPPELREGEWGLQLGRENNIPDLITESDVKGVVHAHSTYSDGIHSLRQMAEATREEGYDYLLITDHSQAAFYANGLKEERVREQWAEIDALSEELAPFKLLKGIESDILSDGSLDYPEEILAGFDVVIASVHSNLRMDETKATQRLLTAIANPYTKILGHPTGRLLLSRAGYPIDHRAIIDACAEHRVAIELNASPYRLDLDWSWIPYAVERGVPISINPDAHAMGGIRDIRYGVLAARKGGLTAQNCLNARSADEFLGWFR